MKSHKNLRPHSLTRKRCFLEKPQEIATPLSHHHHHHHHPKVGLAKLFFFFSNTDTVRNYHTCQLSDFLSVISAKTNIF